MRRVKRGGVEALDEGLMSRSRTATEEVVETRYGLTSTPRQIFDLRSLHVKLVSAE
jgi:hypothetical protein